MFRPVPILAALAVLAGSLSFAGVATVGTCDPIIEAGNRNQQEFQAFTQQAYSDGEITPEESAKAADYTRNQEKISADLAKCIETGQLPPGYQTPLSQQQQRVVDAATALREKVTALLEGIFKASPKQQAQRLGKVAGLSARAKRIGRQWGKQHLPKTAASAGSVQGGPELASLWRAQREAAAFRHELMLANNRKYLDAFVYKREAFDRIATERYRQRYLLLGVEEQLAVQAELQPKMVIDPETGRHVQNWYGNSQSTSSPEKDPTVG